MSERVLYEDEEIRSVVGFDSYKITSYGRVWTDKSNKWLKLVPDNNGYLVVSLYRNGGIRFVRKVHQLVLEAFVRERIGNEQTRHLDDNKTNNRVDNLIWGTCTENYEDKIKVGKDNNGENSGKAILTKDKVNEIRQKYKTRQYTQLELAGQYNVGRTTIQKIVNNLVWKHLV